MTCAGCEDCPFDGSSINKDGDNYPFELHITVSAKSDIEQFKHDCAALGVKPILIDAQRKDGASMLDLMTSSVVHGSYQHALNTSFLLAADFAWMGYEVLRRKLETVPWHPAADNPTGDQYFECHLAVKSLLRDRRRLERIVKRHGGHLSRNAFKSLPDDQCITMVTIRSQDSRESFDHLVRDMKWVLEMYAFEVEKTITEFAIFDDKISHDAAWISPV